MQRKDLIFAAALLLAIAIALGMTKNDAIEQRPAGIFEAAAEPVMITEKIERQRTAIPCTEQRYSTCMLRAGEEQLARQGSEGVAEQTIKVTYENGKEVARQVLSEQTVLRPTDRIMLYGVEHQASAQTHPAEPQADNGVLQTPDGDKLYYTKVLSCTATAYSCEGFTGTTAIGTTARIGAVAVDPNYIPYGTKMYIVSDDGEYIYGIATAEDCGNFRGYHIDLYFDTVSECWTFGRRSITVYLLA